MTRKRPGFTILEVLLSSAIGVILMAALYAAMNLQLRHAQTGREVVERSLLVRSIFSRIGNDIALALAPVTPAPPSQSSSGSGAGGAGGTGAASGATGASGGATGGAGGAAAGTSSGTTTGTSTTTTGGVVINLGVQGDNSRLILNVSRFARDLTDGSDGQPPASDLRRVTYWLCTSEPTGLCRQEFKPVTSDDETNVLPPDVPDEASYVFADEVKSLQFQYFDGTAWQDSWDGTLPGLDGATPQGPPQAIAITIEVETPGQPRKTYRHVVAIPTANGLTQTSIGTSTTGS